VEFIISNTTFERNTATFYGGAIYFNRVPPSYPIPNKFIDNEAPYGSDIASYPIDVRASRLDNVTAVSGQPFGGEVHVEVSQRINIV